MRKVAIPLVVLVLCTLGQSTGRAASSTIVISEFRTRGTVGGNDEFIEIHNISAAPVSVGGWKIRGSNNAGTIGDRVTITAGVTIGPGCFYLMTNSASGGYSGAVPGNQTYGTGITDDGGIAITLADNTIIDAVGMSTGSAFKEGTTLTPTTSNADRGIERKPGGANGHTTDTDNNAADFQAITPGNPQNASSTCIQYEKAPSVSSTVPAAGTSNWPVINAIHINFSEAVAVGANAFTLTCNNSPFPFSFIGSGAAWTIAPAPELPYGANCTVVVNAAAITDTDPNDPPDNMLADYTFSFDTEPAIDTAPAIISTTPADGALDVDAAAGILINFSESVTATLTAFAIDCGSGAVAFGQTSGASSAFMLDPNVNLPGGALCQVTVGADDISDLDSNDPPDHLAGDYAFSFTTATPPATNVVINEIDSDTPGSGVDFAEFVELYDGGGGHTSLNGLTVVFYNGNGDVSYAAFDLDGKKTDANGYFTLGNPDVPGVDLVFDPGASGFLQNGADAVALVIGNASSFPNGTGIGAANVLDAVVYDTDDADDPGLLPLLNAGQPQVNENGGGDGPNQSVGRCANGTGGARNTATYKPGVPSPDGPNNCPPPQPPSNIVISQFYGSGGVGGALFENDFVELYNKSDSETVDITGWTLQYAAVNGSSWDFNKTPLGGPIAPHEYYLVKLASNGDTGEPLPDANISGPINMSGSNGKIALVATGDSLAGLCPLANPNLRDFVGYGTADCGEGNTRAPALSNVTADFRLNGGATDTDSNFADFTSAAPAPRRTAPIVELPPFLVSSDPASNGFNAPRDPTIVLTFSEPVTTVEPFFTLTCDASGPHTYQRTGTGQFVDLTINEPLTPAEKCTVTVLRTGIHDVDTDDDGNTDMPPYNYLWTFTVASGAAPPYPKEVHLTFGNPSNAVADLQQFDNYLMEKDEYALSYNRDDGRPNWVSWHLSGEWYGTLARNDTFRADPLIPYELPWYRVQGFDFSGSGFDRGHMVPNADRDNQNAIPINQATYLMTNMVAQAAGNNQGPWADMEGYLRTLADAGNELYIVAGPAGIGGTGSNGFKTEIAGGRVKVPASTWKVVLVLPKGVNDVSRVQCSTRSIAVIMPNEELRPNLWTDYLTTIDAVEALTGYDFFSNLPDDLQYCVEHFEDGEDHVADVTPPSIQCDSADGMWHADNVTLSCTATDGGSGLANAADASFTLATLVPGNAVDANAPTDTRVVCDALGNCATAGPIAGNKIDRTTPTVTLASPVDGALYSLGQSVVASFACADTGSGVASCIGTAADGAAIDTASSGPHAFVATATDVAGNTASVTVSYTVTNGPAHKRTPGIFITNIPAGAVNGGSFTPAYSYDGDGIIHLKSETPSVCKVLADSVVNFIGAGTCTLVASATPTGSVNPALGPAQSFVIAP